MRLGNNAKIAVFIFLVFSAHLLWFFFISTPILVIVSSFLFVNFIAITSYDYLFADYSKFYQINSSQAELDSKSRKPFYQIVDNQGQLIAVNAIDNAVLRAAIHNINANYIDVTDLNERIKMSLDQYCLIKLVTNMTVTIVDRNLATCQIVTKVLFLEYENSMYFMTEDDNQLQCSQEENTNEKIRLVGEKMNNYENLFDSLSDHKVNLQNQNKTLSPLAVKVQKAQIYQGKWVPISTKIDPQTPVKQIFSPSVSRRVKMAFHNYFSKGSIMSDLTNPKVDLPSLVLHKK